MRPSIGLRPKHGGGGVHRQIKRAHRRRWRPCGTGQLLSSRLASEIEISTPRTTCQPVPERPIGGPGLSLHFAVLVFAVRQGIMEHCTVLGDASFSPVATRPCPASCPSFTRVRRRRILRTSPYQLSRKFATCSSDVAMPKDSSFRR